PSVVMLFFTTVPPPSSPLFPYTTLFRSAIIGFLGAFHGRSYGGLSLTASKAVQRSGFAPFLPEIHHVPYGYHYRCEYCRGESERSEEHTSELQSLTNLVCRLLL